MICRKSDLESVQIAVDYIRRGKVVVLPTDTVYGFSGIVDGRHYSYHTYEKICAIKNRDEGKNLIQLIAKPEDVKKYTRDVIPAELLEKWPGPLTIIVHTFAEDGNFETTAFRCPGDEWLREIIARCGAPIYSTSVNRSGHPVLDNIQQIKDEFGKDVELIIDDGDKKGGVPSTIVAIDESGNVKVVREGAVEIHC
ncbi:MAG: threonylcarbamoyl-AMP synthase [Treponema sp.]|uniref:L-threonylcarbamoyladenylate synthase n=1 Tax=Treponema sp. TaxID=166 RepID=UPI001B7C6904|nr:L-threonylcarbamoyladenylate synthase [Treponema sp.]MBP3771183.1 threonylcarbamoyl-AMP synthase [Treponema sp.]MBQ9281550.1 threonylcarbamoyl-AMP synthase [Treponema sp.]